MEDKVYTYFMQMSSPPTHNIFHLQLFGSMMGTPGHEGLPEQAPHRFLFLFPGLQS